MKQSRIFRVLGWLILFHVIDVSNSPSAELLEDLTYENSIAAGIICTAKLVAGTQGLILVSQPNVNRVTLHDINGSHFGSTNNIDHAFDLVVLGNSLYVGTGHFLDLYDIQRSLRMGAFDHQFGQTNDIKIISSGLPNIVDSKAHRIKVFSLAGDYPPP